jgi:REP element-mobilizing transposase RayT
MRQLSFFPPPQLEHGGVLSVGRRRSRRVLATKRSLHVALRSDFATQEKSLLKHSGIVVSTLRKAARLFHIRIYKFALCGNHLHILMLGKHRDDIQNFFRVFAGHTAQMILARCPITPNERRQHQEQHGQPKGCLKNQRKFWRYLTYSRIISWGRQFARVSSYIIQNTLEALNVIAYRTRQRKRASRAGPGRKPPIRDS